MPIARILWTLVPLVIASPLFGHDTWVQTNTNLVRLADQVHIDLCLGNHGNHHRDFRFASKIDLAESQLILHAPLGKTYDLKSDLVDLGYAPKEGFWSARYVTAAPGMHLIEHTVDKIVNHGQPSRSRDLGGVRRRRRAAPASAHDGARLSRPRSSDAGGFAGSAL